MLFYITFWPCLLLVLRSFLVAQITSGQRYNLYGEDLSVQISALNKSMMQLDANRHFLLHFHFHFITRFSLTGLLQTGPSDQSEQSRLQERRVYFRETGSFIETFQTCEKKGVFDLE